MSTDRPLATKAASLRQQLEVIEKLEGLISTIRETLDAYPELCADFAEELRLLAGPELIADTPLVATRVTPSGGIHARVPSTAERMLAYFDSNDNQPATLEEVAKAIGGNEITLRQIVYKRHKDKFERVRLDNTNQVYWRVNVSTGKVQDQEGSEDTAESE